MTRLSRSAQYDWRKRIEEASPGFHPAVALQKAYEAAVEAGDDVRRDHIAEVLLPYYAPKMKPVDDMGNADMKLELSWSKE